ncbi:MAG: hypothetical protein WDN76_07435 [Alphaproteobacteria bacterium]
MNDMRGGPHEIARTVNKYLALLLAHNDDEIKIAESIALSPTETAAN